MIKQSVKNRIDLLSKNNLFATVKKDDLILLCEKFCVDKKFKKGKLIFSKDSSECCIGILSSGSATVNKEYITINRLQSGDMFGAVTLYNDCDKFVNNIIAQSDCTVVFISKEGVDYLIMRSPEFAKKYIKYLSQRIYFLNSKIESYTTPSAKNKLLTYFESNSNNGVYEIKIKMTELSNQLNLSRASLYRAMDELVNDKKIEKNGNIIKLL